MTDTVPSDESITGRHLVRLMGAFDAAAQIAGKGGPSGGGGGHMPSMGGRGSMSRPRPSAAHYGHSRGYGYHRYHTGYRGHGGLAYNGRPMGYWGGWAFPWIMMGSFWYPYWFFLNGAALAAFYEAQRTQAQFMYGGERERCVSFQKNRSKPDLLNLLLRCKLWCASSRSFSWPMGSRTAARI